MRKMIEEDPKRHMFAMSSPYHILNRWNTHRQSPLYVAAKHGHLDMVQFLVSQGADPLRDSLIAKREAESVLEVAGRWSHVQIVQYLLETVEWDREQVAKAFVESESSAIRGMLASYSRRRFGRAYTCVKLGAICKCLFPRGNQVVPL